MCDADKNPALYKDSLTSMLLCFEFNLPNPGCPFPPQQKQCGINRRLLKNMLPTLILWTQGSRTSNSPTHLPPPFLVQRRQGRLEPHFHTLSHCALDLQCPSPCTFCWSIFPTSLTSYIQIQCQRSPAFDKQMIQITAAWTGVVNCPVAAMSWLVVSPHKHRSHLLKSKSQGHGFRTLSL